MPQDKNINIMPIVGADSQNSSSAQQLRTYGIEKFSHNAYRILGLPGGASFREIQEAAESMSRAARVGKSKTPDLDLPWLGPVTREESEIRDAFGRLAVPSHRLIERLFWFYDPEAVQKIVSLESLENAIAIQASAPELPNKHDRAVLQLMAVLLLDPEVKKENRWLEVLAQWAEVVQIDEYWYASIDLEMNGGFEPTATAEEMELLRSAALMHMADVLAGIARDAIARDMSGLCYRALYLLRKAQLPGTITAAFESEILGAHEDRFETLCMEMRRKCNDNVQRTDGNAEFNRQICEEALACFNGEVDPALNRILAFAGGDSSPGLRVRESAAICLNDLALAYTWADDFVQAGSLQSRACSLVPQNSAVRGRIAELAHKLAKSAREQRIWKDLKPIDSAPSLSTMNGFGFRLYGRSDVDPDTGSYLSTYYFVALFIPIIPIARYRVITADLNSFHFFGKAPLRTFDKWHLGIVLATLLYLIIIGVVNSDSSTSSSYNPPQYTAPSSTSRPLAGASQQEISGLKSEIDASRIKISADEEQLRSKQSELEELSREIQIYKVQISKFESNMQLGLLVNEVAYQKTINAHNNCARRYNAISAELIGIRFAYNQALDAINRKIDFYNDLIKR